MRRQTPERVVITGYALASPVGENLDEQIDAIWEGRPTFKPISRFETEGTEVCFGGETLVDWKALPDRKVKKLLTPKDIISLKTIINAAAHAKIGEPNPERFGLYIGAGNTWLGDLLPYITLLRYCIDEKTTAYSSRQFGAQLLDEINPILVTQAMLNNSLCFGSKTLDARGPNGNYMQFEVSSLQAMGEAYRCLQSNRADICIAGGFSPTLEAFNLTEGRHDQKYAQTNQFTTGGDVIAKPYDKDRCGAVPTEASGYLVMETRTSAKKRGATIYGEVTGYNLSSDGMLPMFETAAHSRGVTNSVTKCMQEANVTNDQIDVVMGSGCGAVTDALEAASLWQLFGTDVPVSSIKGSFGEAEEAGPAISAIIACEAARNGALAPTHNLKNPDPACGDLRFTDGSSPVRTGQALITGTSRLGVTASMMLACNTCDS